MNKRVSLADQHRRDDAARAAHGLPGEKTRESLYLPDDLELESQADALDVRKVLAPAELGQLVKAGRFRDLQTAVAEAFFDREVIGSERREAIALLLRQKIENDIVLKGYQKDARKMLAAKFKPEKEREEMAAIGIKMRERIEEFARQALEAPMRRAA